MFGNTVGMSNIIMIHRDSLKVTFCSFYKIKVMVGCCDSNVPTMKQNIHRMFYSPLS